jgi:predicted acylesterase/phospholipase RssA
MIKDSKTALVLAGGGLTGAVYEIGALRAIDDLLIDRTVNDFDIFVGTSAGALVASFLSKGVSPQEMLQVIDGSHPYAGKFERKHIFDMNTARYLQWGLNLPGKLLDAWFTYLRNIGDMSLFDLVWSLSEALPSGLYDGMALARFVQQGLQDLGFTDDFQRQERELYIIATDLDSGERAIFGNGYIDAPISKAVAASSALPMLYSPVQIGDREYIDGGMRGTASIDLAIERGANLVVVINPLVPYDNQQPLEIPTKDSNDEPLTQEEKVHLSKKGVQSIANQVIRIVVHSGLHYHVKQLRRAHPQVDIILIEPGAEDFQMFFNNIMRYSARLAVAKHGFESVTLDLAEEYPMYKETLGRHGIPISRRLVIDELNEIAASNHDPQVIRRIMEAKDRDGCGWRRADRPLCKLERSLSELEMILYDAAHRS